MAQGIGFGSTLAYGDSPTTLGGIVDGWESESETEMVDITLLGDAYKKFAPADTDPGELSFDVALDVNDLGLIAMQAAQAAGTLVPFVVSYANGGSESFSGYVKTIGSAVKKRELITRKLVIKLSGNPGFATSD